MAKHMSTKIYFDNINNLIYVNIIVSVVVIICSCFGHISLDLFVSTFGTMFAFDTLAFCIEPTMLKHMSVKGLLNYITFINVSYIIFVAIVICAWWFEGFPEWAVVISGFEILAAMAIGCQND